MLEHALLPLDQPAVWVTAPVVEYAADAAHRQ
jgi:hypothetical protein